LVILRRSCTKSFPNDQTRSDAGNFEAEVEELESQLASLKSALELECNQRTSHAQSAKLIGIRQTAQSELDALRQTLFTTQAKIKAFESKSNELGRAAAGSDSDLEELVWLRQVVACERDLIARRDTVLTQLNWGWHRGRIENDGLRKQLDVHLIIWNGRMWPIRGPTSQALPCDPRKTTAASSETVANSNHWRRMDYDC
jgi:multidrug efflux pump subunit AcrA (membrane-fusion protein)